MVRWVAAFGLVVVVVVGCEESDPAASPLTPVEATRCGARGAPVSLAALVRAFRANGIALDLAADSCRSTPEARRRAGLADATNFGQSGIDQTGEAADREGGVICHLSRTGVGPTVRMEKLPGDTETAVAVLNVYCSLYPSSPSAEKEQVDRVARALTAASRAAQ